jgi:hypothetical protein
MSFKKIYDKIKYYITKQYEYRSKYLDFIISLSPNPKIINLSLRFALPIVWLKHIPYIGKFKVIKDIAKKEVLSFRIPELNIDVFLGYKR